MALGTAPRRVSPGVWKTRKGKTLAPAQAVVWEGYYRAGRTDGSGHMRQPSVVVQQPRVARAAAPKPSGPRLEAGQPEPKKPGFETVVRAKKGDQQALAQIKAYQRHRQAKTQAEAQTEAMVSRQYAGVEQTAARGYKTVSPVAAAVVKSLSPTELAKQTYRDVRRKNVGAAALDIASILPVGRGAKAVKVGLEARAAVKAPRLAKAAARTRRTLTAGEKTVQLPGGARSRITRTVIEKPAEKISERLPGAPIVGAEARVAKHAGRETGLEAERARTVQTPHLKALPKEGSPEDVAHFWWAQLPASHRNVEGLKLVRAKQAAELKRVESGKALESLQRQKKAIQAKLGAAQQPKESDPLKQAFAKYRRESAGEPDAMDFDEFKTYAERYPKQLEHYFPERKVVTEVTPAAEKPAAEKLPTEDRFKLMNQLQDVKLRLAGLGPDVEDLTSSLALLDKAIKRAPKHNPKITEAVHSLSTDRRGILEAAGKLDPAQAAERQKLVSRWAGLEPTGEEAFIGHRLDATRVRGATPTLVPGRGVGRPRLPQGVSQRNQSVLIRKGRVRQSTHAARQDWEAAQTYRQALRARDDLALLGKPFTGRLPKDHVLVNPRGRVIPPHWKADRIAQMGEHGWTEDEIRKASKEILGTYATDEQGMGEMLRQAAEEGVHYDELRVVPKKTVARYYSQFERPPYAGRIAKAYDAALDATSASIIFSRLGYVPKNVVQNLMMAVPHQGVRFFANLPRAAQVLKDSELRHLVAGEVGGAQIAQIAKEMQTAGKLKRIPGKVAGWSTSAADVPLRVSAFLHEAAAEGIIPKLSPVLSRNDRLALHQLLTDPKMRPVLNDVRARSVDAMADFSRLTPTQRRWARRFLFIPGWLTAGSRYPIHFAATHPGRSAALAYVAAGEPGAPERLKMNKPVNEYFAKGMPPWLEGVPVAGRLLRTSSIDPVGMPRDIIRAARGDVATFADFTNPLVQGGVNVAAGRVEFPSGETKKVGYGKAAVEALRGLAPGEQFIQEEIAGKTRSKTYEGGRLERLYRELGIVPVKVSTPTEARIRDFRKQVVEAAVKAGQLPKGGKLGPQTSRAVGLLEQRWKMYAAAGVKAGVKNYQRKAYAVDLKLAVRLGKVKQADADRWLGLVDKAYARAGDDPQKRRTIDDEVSGYRERIADDFFDDRRITGVLHGLKQAGYTVRRPAYR